MLINLGGSAEFTLMHYKEHEAAEKQLSFADSMFFSAGYYNLENEFMSMLESFIIDLKDEVNK